MSAPTHGQTVAQQPDAPTPVGNPAPIPVPVYFDAGRLVTWGSKTYAGEISAGQAATLAQLVAWGESAPVPLQLNPIERIALAFYGTWLQDDANFVFRMSKATKGIDGRWGNANGDGTWHGQAACWASDPGRVLFGPPLPASPYAPVPVRWGSLGAPANPHVGADDARDRPNVVNIYGWGPTAAPSLRLTAIETNALAQSGNDAGWAKVEGFNGAGTIDLTDPRYEKNADGTWQNRNHIDPTGGQFSHAGNLGLVTDIASKPKNGVAGYIDALEHDVSNNPLGAFLAIVVAVPLAGLGPFLFAAAQGDAIAIGVSQAVGSDAILNANKWAATHPAEIGTVVAGAEIAVAGTIIGAKGLAKFGAELGAKGLGDALAPQDTSRDPGSRNFGGPGGLPQSTSSRKRWWQFLGGG